MDRLVTVFAPRSAPDFLGRLLTLLMVLGAMNWLRDQVEHGVGADGYFNNFVEAGVVGVLPAILALMLIGHLNRLQQSLAQAALTDPLTGLPNRRAFFDAVQAVLPRPGGVLLMLDADHFKVVNDTLGHGAGDDCLVRIAALLRDNVRDGDLVARLGGEEFAVLLVGARRADADLIGTRLVAGVTLGRSGQVVTLSVGAVCTGSAADIAGLLARADSALYAAKAAGRARLVFAPQDAGPPPATAIGRRDAA